MTGTGFHPVQALIGTARQSLRTLMWRSALVAAATLIGAVGIGFLLFAAFAALRFAIGSGAAALVMGAALVLLAAVVLALAGQTAPPGPSAVPASDPVPPPSAPMAAPKPADAASMAVFTTAFVIGRYLADRTRH